MMFPVVMVVLLLRRHTIADTITPHWRHGVTAGICSVVAYGLVVYAAASAPLSIVSALSQTSVVMAALIGTLFLGERPWQSRLLASTLLVGGVALMITFR
jgi:drug/metabolite transporter (DMT)-like permease